MEGRKSLSRNLFPYGKTKLSQHGRITLEKPTNTTASTDADAADHIQQLTLVPHRISSSKMAEEKEEEKARRLELEEEVDEAINLLKALYGIPERWHNMQKTYTQATDQQRQDTEAQTMQAMLMSETLVRRICQFLGHSERFLGIQERIESQNTSLRGSNVSQVIYNDLKHLLYYLDHDDQGKEPFVFAMTWILAAKIKEEVQPATIGGKSPLVDEIVSWFLQNATTLKQRDDHVEGLLKRLEE
jgi:hypothetical protein